MSGKSAILKAGILGAGLALLPGVALAGHGKAGLWTVTSTTNMNMAMPPEVAAQMKAMNMKMPSNTHTSQMCMSQAEVDASTPPHIDQGATGCTTKVTSASASGMTAVMTCTGRMKGTGWTSSGRTMLRMRPCWSMSMVAAS